MAHPCELDDADEAERTEQDSGIEREAHGVNLPDYC
jgi:hypothetical protein